MLTAKAGQEQGSESSQNSDHAVATDGEQRRRISTLVHSFEMLWGGQAVKARALLNQIQRDAFPRGLRVQIFQHCN
jgi:hypothetical protein